MRVVITGANKGIGFQIVKSLLCDPLVGSILVTSRNPKKGQSAMEGFAKINKNKIPIDLFELDLCDQKSISNFLKHLKQEKKEIDRVIFNAGISMGNSLNEKIVEITMQTNFDSNVKMTEFILKENILKKDGRIILVSSTKGSLKILKKNTEVLDLFSKYETHGFTMETLQTVVSRYRHEILEPKLSKKWPVSVYSISKLFLTIYASLLARLHPHYDIYACCPGWCDTDMTKGKFTEIAKGSQTLLTPSQGAETPVYLTTGQIPKEYSGKFIYQKQVTSILDSQNL